MEDDKITIPTPERVAAEAIERAFGEMAIDATGPFDDCAVLSPNDDGTFAISGIIRSGEVITPAEAARRGAFHEDAITPEDAAASTADLGDIENG